MGRFVIQLKLNQSKESQFSGVYCVYVCVPYTTVNFAQFSAYYTIWMPLLHLYVFVGRRYVYIRMLWTIIITINAIDHNKIEVKRKSYANTNSPGTHSLIRFRLNWNRNTNKFDLLRLCTSRQIWAEFDAFALNWRSYCLYNTHSHTHSLSMYLFSIKVLLHFAVGIDLIWHRHAIGTLTNRRIAHKISLTQRAHFVYQPKRQTMLCFYQNN